MSEVVAVTTPAVRVQGVGSGFGVRGSGFRVQGVVAVTTPAARVWGLRLIDSCITQLKAQGPFRTCNESKEEKRRVTEGGVLEEVEQAV